jgi:hypothetical protein
MEMPLSYLDPPPMSPEELPVLLWQLILPIFLEGREVVRPVVPSRLPVAVVLPV